MAAQLTLPKARNTEVGLDQQQLYAIGLDHVRRLAHRIWTDHNVHDPGITVLELAAFALTDLTYRANLPIADLLNGSTFFTARDILPGQPLTRLDYRKLIIDVEGVKNAWVEPVALPYFADPATGEILRDRPNRPGIKDIRIRGLYQVRIEYSDDKKTDAEKEEVDAAVLVQVQKHRNLCEDFVGVKPVDRQPFLLCGEIELSPEADTGWVHGEILRHVQQYLAPEVGRYTLRQMLDRRRPDGTPYTAPDVFDGPRLEHGFIDSAELEAADLREQVRLSDIISIVMDIPGVVAVRDMIIGPEQPKATVGSIARSSATATVTTGAPHGFTTGQLITISGANQDAYNGAFDVTVTGPTTFTFSISGTPATPATGTMAATGPAVPLDNRWVVTVPHGKEPTLNASRSRLVYYKRNIPIVPAALETPPTMKRAVLGPEDMPIPSGTPRNLRGYYSFQHHFPVVYGVGDNPLPPSVGVRRLVLASQLKAYLLFFDQVMANYCAQLAEVTRLFSIDPASKATYFSQLVARGSPPQNEVMEAYGASGVAGANALAGRLDSLVETEEERVDRRKRFLDHLIARFAERFHDFALIMRSAFGATDASLIADKCAFLNDYPAISGDRGLAYNYTLKGPQDSWDSFNVTGLEKRLARLLGIGDGSRRDLTDVRIGADASVTGNPASQFGFTLRHAETGKTLLKEGVRLATADLTTKQMLLAFELGQWSSTYFPAQRPDHRWFFDIGTRNGEFVAQSEDFATEAEMATAIVELRTYLRQHYGREGFYVIENLLLRPERDGDASLHFCVDPGCTECAGDDPYSHRIHVILPAYAGRFNDMDFRRFVEEVIREETPAHILPKICWVDEESMRGVQKAYRAWLEIRSGAVTAGRAAKMKALVDVLTNVKSVYPVQTLTDCSAPEGEPRFILGRSALGSKKNND